MIRACIKRKPLYYFLFVFIFLFSCRAYDIAVGIEEEMEEEEKIQAKQMVIEYQPSKHNRYFHFYRLVGKNLVLLPTRSGMGGGGSDEKITKSLNITLSRVFSRSKVITDNQADDYFTDNDLWDDYFEYIQKYSRRGFVTSKDLEEPAKLYKPLKPDYFIATTTDPFMFGGLGFYPQSFDLYIELQIWSSKDRKKVWGAICNGKAQILSPDRQNPIYQELSDRLTNRLIAELMRGSD